MASSTSSISGLVSGLDTSTIISQLMQIEAQPQALLKTRMSTEQSNVTSLQSLNSAFAALATKAGTLSTTSSWSPLSTTSSSSSVTATAGATAVAGSVSFTVQGTASAHQLTFKATKALTDTVTSGSTKVRLDTLDGKTPVDIDTGNGTLAGLVSGINNANAGVSASAVKLDDGTYRLRVVSTSTGNSSDFALTNTDGSDLLGGATVTAGQDAAVTLGADTIHSSTNTFTGLTTGLDVTVADGTPAGTAVTVTSTRDSTSASAALTDLVKSANDILDQIDKLTAYNATTKTSGALAGDPSVRALRSKVVDTVTRAADGTSMASLGVQTDRYGKIAFDATKFATAYATDPGTVATKLGAAATATTPGFAARLAAVAKFASDSTKGTLTTDILGRQSSVTTMQKGIDDWDVKLEAKQESLQKVYTNLEVTLGKLQNQSTWLAGQISGLSSSSSSSSS
jgi:flagellar hook-associated protein 2